MLPRVLFGLLARDWGAPGLSRQVGPSSKAMACRCLPARFRPGISSIAAGSNSHPPSVSRELAQLEVPDAGALCSDRCLPTRPNHRCPAPHSL